MHQQYICGKQITVEYAFKKGSKGERHGTPAERLLAANRPNFIGSNYNLMSTATAYANYLLQNSLAQASTNYIAPLQESSQPLSSSQKIPFNIPKIPESVPANKT